MQYGAPGRWLVTKPWDSGAVSDYEKRRTVGFLNSIFLDTSKADEGRVRAELARSDGANFELYFSTADGAPLSASSAGDAIAIASSHYFMHTGGEVTINAGLGRRVLAGLQEWIGAFRQYSPHKYKQIRFTPTSVIDSSFDTRARGIAAFSGGVDAFFTLDRHKRGRLGYGSVDIEKAVLVHGFDIPLADNAGFSRAREAAENGLELYNVPLVTIETNFRDLPLQSWAHAHGAGVVAAMTVANDSQRVGLIGSTYTYARPSVGWGSAPEIDHLLSSSRLEVRHDGADHSRTRKIEYISQFPEIVNRIRVCFQGSGLGGNCSRCEKCWRTRFALAIFGHEEPSSFDPVPLREANLGRLSDSSRKFWSELSEFSAQSGNNRVRELLNDAISRADENSKA